MKFLIQTFSSKQSDDLVTLNKSLIDEFIKHARENYKKTDGCIALKKNDFLALTKIINKRTKIKIV